VRILKPLGIDAAVKALEAQANQTSAAQRQLALALQQARDEAAQVVKLPHRLVRPLSL